MSIQLFSAGAIAGALGVGVALTPALAETPKMAEVGRAAIAADSGEQFAQVDDELVPTASIVEIVSGVDEFSSLESALDSADLIAPLMGAGPFTVIAPSNGAFDTLSDAVLDALFLTDNNDLLTEVLTYHVLPGAITYSDLETGTFETLGGEELDIVVQNDDITVDGIPLVAVDVPATNGVIHVIQDGVLVPDDVAAELETRLAAEPADPMVEDEVMVEEPEVVTEDPVVEETPTPTPEPATPVRGLW